MTRLRFSRAEIDATVSAVLMSACTVVKRTTRHVLAELLDSVGDNILGKVLCALGEFAVCPVHSYLHKWRDEFEAHIDGGGCPYHGSSSLDGILAPSDQHIAHRLEVLA